LSTIPERHKYKEIKDYSSILKIPDVVSSRKYDGAAFWIYIDKSGRPHFISRRPSVTGKPIERTAQLPHVSNVTLPEFADHVLYSELIHTGHEGIEGKEKHNTLSGILNSGLEKSLARQDAEGPVRVVLTDMKHPGKGTYAEKRETLERIAKAWGKPDLVRTAQWQEGAAEARKLIDSSEKAGHEGIILTSDSLPEHTNPRYKVKHFGTYNLRVSGMQQERDVHGNPKESMGGLHVTDARGREVATVGTGFTKEERAQAWRNPEQWVGKLIQVKAMPSTARRLRAPVYNGEADGEIDAVEE
jgi:hypothetical protein